MKTNAVYWENRDERKEKARKHTELMEKEFPEAIEYSVNKTVTYYPSTKFEKKKNKAEEMKIQVTDETSTQAIYKHHDGRTAVLNFASYKNPGGKFIDGSKAQEECLCHESFLYNVLKEKQDYYDWNNRALNKAMYLNRALYTPDIYFAETDEKFKNGEYVKCDVITCAAPNKSAAQKYQNITNEENYNVLLSRCRFVLDIAQEQGVDTLILGAYGCGVFRQDAEEVAKCFKELFNNEGYSFKNIIFAVPDGKDENLKGFQKVFK